MRSVDLDARGTASSSGGSRGRFLCALAVIAVVYRLTRPVRPDFADVAFRVTLESRCQSIAHREVFGTLTEQEAAHRELAELMARIDGVSVVTCNKGNI